MLRVFAHSYAGSSFIFAFTWKEKREEKKQNIKQKDALKQSRKVCWNPN